MQVGEPANLSIIVAGEGNFGSLKTPNLLMDKRWRVFSPQESFEDGDFLGYKGQQTYRYVVIPLSADLQRIPAFDYTYFDVESRKFVTLKSEPIPIQIAGENIVRDDEISPAENVQEEMDEVEVSLNSAIRWDMGKTQVLGRPFFQKLSFFYLQLLLVLGFVVLVLLRWRTLKIERDEKYARQLQIQTWIRKYLRLAGQGPAREEDSEQFYESAFLAFCAVVASCNDANVEAITVEDVETRLQKMDLNENIKRVINGYLTRYEQHRFSGSALDNPPLTHEFNRLRSVLKKFDNQLEVAVEG